MDPLSLPFEVVCINDKNKPSEIPISKWVTEEMNYTVTNIGMSTEGTPGFILKEINLDDSCFPYGCFSPERFGIVSENKQSESEEAVKELLKKPLEYEKI